jgi:hypothetical protein
MILSMKTITFKLSIFLVLLLFILPKGFSQEKSRKELKAERKIALQKQIDSLVNSREFVFIGTFAHPQGQRSVNLASNSNFMKFYTDSISSDMPFYGKAYNVGYGGDSGLKFAGKAEKYTVKKEKKNYQIDAVVKGDHDSFQIFLSVSFSGGASLSINSNNRNPISYSGDISALKK